jgi:hypothetical protein
VKRAPVGSGRAPVAGAEAGVGTSCVGAALVASGTVTGAATGSGVSGRARGVGAGGGGTGRPLVATRLGWRGESLAARGGGGGWGGPGGGGYDVLLGAQGGNGMKRCGRGSDENLLCPMGS